jgi:putative acetyltransferase
MIEILPIQPHQIEPAKYIITAVAQRIFEPDMPVAEFYEILRQEHELKDVDNYQQMYGEPNGGLFLVAVDDGTVIGTGAVRNLGDQVAELKRLWLLETYHGQGIGYQIVSKLLDFCRQRGYRFLRLQTSHEQERALHFYRRMGFYEIPAYNDEVDEVFLELKL